MTIQIPESSSGAQISSAVRDVLKIAGGILATRGYLEASQVDVLAGAVIVLAPVIWSQISVWLKHAKMVKMADHADDDVAVVVKK